MSEQAEEFLAQWEIEHIKMVARSDREDQARRLALRCREDAARAGISGQDLEAAAEGNLIGNMLQALEYDLLYFKSLGIRLLKINQSGRNVMHAVIRNYSGRRDHAY